MELAKYTELLAAKTAIPGGGSAISYVASLATALLEMSLNLTSGKKKYQEYEEDITKHLISLDKARIKLLECQTKDEEMFMPLAEAYKTKENIEECLLKAIEPPKETLDTIIEVIKQLDYFKDKCSKLALSDVACASSLALAALLGAKANIKANTKLLTNRHYAETLNKEVDNLVEKYRVMALNVYKTIDEELSNV